MEAQRVRVGCPECGGVTMYDRKLRCYVCKSCGLTMTRQELMEERKRLFERVESEEEEKERRKREYLKWWLTSREKK